MIWFINRVDKNIIITFSCRRFKTLFLNVIVMLILHYHNIMVTLLRHFHNFIIYIIIGWQNKNKSLFGNLFALFAKNNIFFSFYESTFL